MGVVFSPAAQQGLHHVGSVEVQVGDVLVGVEVADAAVGDAPGHNDVVFVQLAQDPRRAEVVHHIDVDLICLHLPGLLLDPVQALRGGDKHDHVYHG